MPPHQPIFELFDPTVSDIMQEALGFWNIATQPSKESISFTSSSCSVPDKTVEAPPLWRISLPGNSDLAAAYLRSGEQRLQLSQSMLRGIPERLHILTQAQLGGGQAFDTSSGLQLSEAEIALFAQLQEIQQDDSALSFGLRDHLPKGLQQPIEQFQNFVTQVQKTMTHYVWVETNIQDLALARTSIGWTGDAQTVWRQGCDSAQSVLHQRALGLALSSRDSLLQTLLIAVRCVVQLSCIITAPGSLLLMLPAVWKSINQMLSGASEESL